MMRDILRDDSDTIRFKQNDVVEKLLDLQPMMLNQLAITAAKCSQADWEEFYQLIGYSLCGYHELSRVSDESALAASDAARKTFGIDPSVSVGCRDGDGCEIHSGVEKENALRN